MSRKRFKMTVYYHVTYTFQNDCMLSCHVRVSDWLYVIMSRTRFKMSVCYMSRTRFRMTVFYRVTYAF